MPPDAIAAEIAARLARAGCVAAEQEACELHDAAPDGPTLRGWVQRRTEGEPLAWITGSTTFCGRRLHVAPDVYVPRPHTEELATRAAALLPIGGWALDLCTGTGAVAAHLVATDATARVVGTDLEPRAAACARRNGVAALVSDLADAVAGDGRWNVVSAVAPYVPTAELRFLPVDAQRYEPGVALEGGHDGLDVVRGVVDAAARLLRPGGALLLELGGTQDEALAGTLHRAGFDRRESWSDEAGDLRGVVTFRT